MQALQPVTDRAVAAEVQVDVPMPRWQAAAVASLSALGDVTVTPLPGTPGWAAPRIPMLARAPLPENQTRHPPDALVIDLTGRSSRPAWQLVCGDGQPLAAPFAFARDWSRPRRIGSVYMVDEERRVHASGHFAVNGMGYGRMLNQILRAAAWLPAQAWHNHLLRRNTAGAAIDIPPPSPMKRAGVTAMAGGGLRFLSQKLGQLSRQEMWMVGLAEQSIEGFLESSAAAVTWLTRADGTKYCADPFAHPDDPQEIWWESYDYRTGLGTLQRLHRTPDGTAVIEPVDLGVDVHLSYPFLDRIDGTVVFIPEMNASGTTRIYRIRADHSRECLAILPVQGIDPVVFRFEDRLWLALTDRAIDARSNLCLWHAPALDGPWTPHPGNPVKLDVRSARCAGTPFWHRGALYRPAQDCSQTYGGAVTINRIVECTPTAFREEVVAAVKPDPAGAGPYGLHTLSRCGDRTLIDGKVYIHSLAGLNGRMRRAIARLVRGNARGSTGP